MEHVKDIKSSTICKGNYDINEKCMIKLIKILKSRHKQ